MTASNFEALFQDSEKRTSALQMALAVAYELAAYGPGTAPQIAERMTDHDEENHLVRDEWVDEALDVLDQWSLLEFSGLEDTDPVSLKAWRS